MLLAELADEIDEIVGHRLAQRIVIDGAKRPPEIAFPGSTIGRSRLLRVPWMTGSLRLASFPGTQLLVPPRAGLGALILIWLRGATPGFALPRFGT